MIRSDAPTNNAKHAAAEDQEEKWKKMQMKAGLLKTSSEGSSTKGGGADSRLSDSLSHWQAQLALMDKSRMRFAPATTSLTSGRGAILLGLTHSVIEEERLARESRPRHISKEESSIKVRLSDELSSSPSKYDVADSPHEAKPVLNVANSQWSRSYCK